MRLHGLTIVPHGTSIDFIRHRVAAVGLSGLLVLISVGSLAVQGLSFGIDFAGGLLVEVRTDGPADLPRLRDELGALGLGQVALQGLADPDTVSIRVQRQEGGDDAQNTALDLVRETLGERVAEYRRVEVVGPKVGDELIVDGAMAIGFAILAITAYIWFRFEWQFALGAMVALLHDVIVTLGLFSLFQLEFGLTTVAAVLTIAGYSINDTVVAYDRVRENLRKFKKLPLPDLLNHSLNDVLARTVLTSGTTLVAVVAIYLFGGEVLRGFALALIWGIVVGTYSSIYLAMPILIHFNLRPDVLGGPAADDGDTDDAAAAGDAAGRAGA